MAALGAPQTDLSRGPKPPVAAKGRWLWGRGSSGLQAGLLELPWGQAEAGVVRALPTAVGCRVGVSYMDVSDSLILTLAPPPWLQEVSLENRIRSVLDCLLNTVQLHMPKLNTRAP